ncbi:MAG TPA: gliding motility-associated protein GldE [Chitinophagaceae bacterium]|nr:gliding motility-associated protein GldE [Chitinophagaceae bacterium]
MDSHKVVIFINDFFTFTLLAANAQGNIILGIVLTILLILTFIISGSEVALFSLNNKDINVLKTKQHSAAKRITNLLEEPKEVYASLLIAGTFINICIIILANYMIDQYLRFGNLPYSIIVLIKALIIAFVVVFFGRLLPKVFATQNNLRFAYDYALVIEGLHLLLRRISKSIVSLADGIGRRLGANRSEAMSIQELDEAIDIKTDEEASPEEKNIMKGIVKFGNISVKQIMRSRLDVNGVDYSISFPDLVKKVEELHYSRLPVYKGSLDEVAGIIHTKDLLPFLDESEAFDWRPLLRPPYFVPESKLIEDLLRDFQQKQVHFAVVVDEFGGTSGIVTMEDVLEEVIGDIKDEFDEEESGVKKLDDQNYIFEGKTMIHDMCKIMRLPMDTFDKVRGESESLAGLILEIAGEFPATNAVISCGDFDFTVLETANNRIRQVQVTINPED